MRFGIALSLLAVALAGCGGSPAKKTTAPSSSSKVLVGAGSTFVYPLVSQWISDYAKRTGVTVTYGAVGSGGGIAAITDRTVDFGASDAPLTPDQLTKCNGCVEIPWALGGTSVAYHLNGAPQHLKLTGAVLADIFLGKITSWSDPAIAKTNPGTHLPSTRIAPVFRSDASGTSYNFTDYLSHVSPAWKAKVGTSTQPSFPTGQGAKGSSGVSGIVGQTDGTITYVDVAYATTSHFSYAAVENAANSFTLPSVASCRAAAAAASAPKPNAAISIVDPPASASTAYPICTFTYSILAQKSPKAAALRAFLTYAVTNGQQFGPKLLFAPLPPAVVAADKQAIARITS
jgi:phosphate transport system substrate-binding protein